MYVLFMFILINNLVGMVPYSFAPTSHFILTFSLSFTIVLGAPVFIHNMVKIYCSFILLINKFIMHSIDNKSKLNNTRFRDIFKGIKLISMFYALLFFLTWSLLKFFLLCMVSSFDGIIISMLVVSTICALVSFLFVGLVAGFINKKTIYSNIVIRFFLFLLLLTLLFTVLFFFLFFLFIGWINPIKV